MNELPQRDPQSAEEAFAVFLERCDEDPSQSFEDWVEGRADAGEQQALFAAFQAVRRHLPAPLTDQDHEGEG